MSGEIRDPRFERPSAARSRLPIGRYPIPDGAGLRAVKCVHCANALGISTWDDLNGFLVECPHCRGYHGRPWGFQRTLLAGLFLNVLSFFMTLRPRQAVATIVVFALFCWSLLAMAAANDTNAAYMVTALSVVVMGPVLINAIALVRHQMRLDAAPPATDSQRQT